MNFKQRFFLILICLVSVIYSQTIQAQDIPQNSITSFPDLIENINSDDLNRIISALDKVVATDDQKCFVQYKLPLNLTKEDYNYVVKKVLEKNLTLLDKKSKPEIWSKLSLLISKYEMKEFLDDIVIYLNESDISTQATIITTLKTLKAKEFEVNVSSLLNSSEPYIRQIVLETLISFKSRTAIPALVSKLKSINSSDRFWAIEKLVEINAKESSPQIAERLKDEDPNLRYFAIDALVKLDAKTQVSKVWQFFDSEKTSRNKSSALAALLYFDQKQVLSIYIERYKAAIENNVQNSVEYSDFEFIYKFKPKLAITALINLWESKERFFEQDILENRFRKTVLQNLVSLKSPLAISIYRENILHKEHYINCAVDQSVVNVLAELDAKEATGDLISAFNKVINDHEDYYLYDASFIAVALVKLGEKSFRKQLIDLAENPKCPKRSQIIYELNKHLDIELWNKIKNSNVKGVDYESVKTNTDIYAKQSNVTIKLEFQTGIDLSKRLPLKDSAYPWMRSGHETNLFSELENIVESIDDGIKPNSFTFIFDSGEVRILKVDKAIKWWRGNVLSNFSY
jgi:HEAT repeat protein